MHGELTFFEIGVPDSGRAQSFYARLFEWQFPPTGEGDQVSIKTPSMKGGLHDQDVEARIAMYFEVDDIDAAVRTVRELGGTAEDPAPRKLASDASPRAPTTRASSSGCTKRPGLHNAAAYFKVGRKHDHDGPDHRDSAARS